MKHTAALRRRLRARGQRAGTRRRLAQAVSAFMLALSLLLGGVPPRPARANSVTFAPPVTGAPFGLGNVGAYSTPVFADLDGDGDLDAVVGETLGNLNYFANSGDALAPAFGAPLTSDPFGLLDMGFYSAPAFADLDGDGDLDAVVGEAAGNLNYFANTGDATAPAFAAPITVDPLGLTDVGSYSAPAFADLDADGDLDAVVGVQSGILSYYQNTGNVTAPAFAAPVTSNPFGLTNVGVLSKPTPAFADLNGDGRLEAFSGEIEGDVFVFLGVHVQFLPVAVRD